MKRSVFTIRLPAALEAQVTQAAAQRGITRTAWAGYLIERGMHLELTQQLIESRDERSQEGAAAGPSVESAQLDTVLGALQILAANDRKLLEAIREKGASTESGAATPAGGLPPKLLAKLVYSGAFVEAMMKKLNASLNRNSSELATIVGQARDQAQVETDALLREAGVHPDRP